MGLCPDLAKGLNYLYKQAFVAIITSSSTQKAGFLLDLFSHLNIKVDAVYRRKGGQTKSVQDYSQLVYDFAMQKNVVISSLCLDVAEIYERND